MKIQVNGELGFDCSSEQMSEKILPATETYTEGCYSKSIQTKASLTQEQFT